MVIEKLAIGKGFETAFEGCGFKCAFITASPQYASGKVEEMKCHLDSDEVFVLLRGKAVLLTKDKEDAPCCSTLLSPDTAYNITQGTWHYLAVSADALVFVAESGTMKKENTHTLQVGNEGITAQLPNA